MSINDVLRERQHVTAVTQDTHVPAGFDMLAQQARLAVERWTCSPLGGFTCDFTRLSYNKLPHLTVAAWNPHCASEVFGSGVAQLWSEICCEAFCTGCAEAICSLVLRSIHSLCRRHALGETVASVCQCLDSVADIRLSVRLVSASREEPFSLTRSPRPWRLVQSLTVATVLLHDVCGERAKRTAP